MKPGYSGAFLPGLAEQSLFWRTTFAFATFLSGYLSYRSLKPPKTPISSSIVKSRIRDSIVTPYAFEMLAAYRLGLLALSIWQALFIMSPRSFIVFTPLDGLPINRDIFVWNWCNGLTLMIIDVCALVRLQAMGKLGKNFTFELREPDKLCTTGLYRWMQHPSYSSGLVVFGLSASFFIRSDGILGSLLPVFDLLGSVPQKFSYFVLTHQSLVNSCISITLWLTVFFAGWRRIIDEEQMLKEKFGREWIQWHQRTARLVPFLF